MKVSYRIYVHIIVGYIVIIIKPVAFWRTDLAPGVLLASLDTDNLIQEIHLGRVKNKSFKKCIILVNCNILDMLINCY